MKIRSSHLLLCFLCTLLPLSPLSRAGEGDSPPKEAKASLLSLREKPLGLPQIKELAPEATVKATVAKDMTSYAVEWKNAKVVINVREDYDQKTQNEGALGWISRFPKKERSTAAAANLQKFIPSVKRSYGIILPQGFDGGGVTSEFLLKLAAELQGLPFTNSSFYDRQGFKILGPPLDPPFFGRAGRNLLLFDKPVDPRELVTGKWDVETVHTDGSEGVTMEMRITAVDDFQADGILLSVGTARLSLSPDGTDEATGMSFDFSSREQWSVKDGRLQLMDVDGGVKTINHRCDNPAMKETLEEVIKELNKADSDPEINWLISRDRELVILEEVELGFTSVMKRRKTP